MDNSENALNVGEVHEQRINTANYHTLTPISLKDLSIGEEDEKHISSNGKHSPDAEEINPVEKQNSHCKEKQEARSVCGKISTLLRDKQSGTRGSYMFRKRRKRSERFAIVGYGTQPTAEEADHDDQSDDSVLLTSSDDEIDVYDHPGPDNILEQDSILTSSSKVIRRQLQNLAIDTKQMKGKGAKMFAKRQERMERFIIDGNSDQTDDNTFETVPAGPLESTKTITDGYFFKASPDNTTPNQDHLKNPEKSPCVNVDPLCPLAEREQSFRPKQLSSWPLNSNIEQSINSEVQQISLEPSDISSYQSGDHHLQNTVFRSVKPPQPTLLPATSPVHANVQDVSFKPAFQHKSSLFTLSLESPRKTWSSVKFNPTAKSNVKPSLDVQEEAPKTAYPCSISSSQAHEKQKHSFASTTTTAQNHPFKSVCTVPIVSKTKASTVYMQPTFAENPTSVKLLQKPLTSKLKPTTDNKENAVYLKQKSVHGDRTPPSTPINLSLDRLKDDDYKPHSSLTDSRQTRVVSKHFSRSENCSSNDTTLTNSEFKLANTEFELVHTEFEDGLKKPKVAACMKLLDPSKGKYEPKVSIVYKPTSSVSKKTTSNDSYSKPPQSNTPVVAAQGLPQTTFLGLSAKSLPKNHQKEPQALGSMAAGEFKGKGARMFEKQQQRMDNYTRESNGSILHGSVKSLHDPSCKGPEDMTKKKMSQVVGEFKKVSTENESQNRPSVTRTTKSKDPYHYHNYYVQGREPSADDFVHSDDFHKATSDSNLSTTSSVTSFDRNLRSSPTVVAGDGDEITRGVGGQHGGRLLRSAPGVACKPKMNLSCEPHSPSLYISSGGKEFAQLPSPPAYENISSFN